MAIKYLTRFAGAALALLVLAGCANHELRRQAYLGNDLAQYDDRRLCASYGALNSVGKNSPIGDNILNEIAARGAVPVNEFGLIERHIVRVGMSECALLASWGPPYRVNRASYGDQWIYGGLYAYRQSFVYVEGGRVTGWQGDY